MAKKKSKTQRSKRKEAVKEKAKEKTEVSQCDSQCCSLKCQIILAISIILIIALCFAVYYLFFVPRDPLTVTLKKIDKIDSKYGISLHDYDEGVAYLRYHPRFPNPINPDDFDPIIEEFVALINGTEPGTPERLIIESRIDLLQSEKLYKLAISTKKGLTDDGFKCSDAIYIQAAAINFESSIAYGRSAVEKLDYILENHYETADQNLNTRSFWIKTVNETYDELDKYALYNKQRIESFCNVTITS
ncbi:MAG: hypothetical protein KKE20_00390 [Nanoarchaeota archaeon]|nr:hypothetical protein [Nanoarchaeota archaeon]